MLAPGARQGYALLFAAILLFLPHRVRRLLGSAVAARARSFALGGQHLFLRLLESLVGPRLVCLDAGGLLACPRHGSNDLAPLTEATPPLQPMRQRRLAVLFQIHE